MSIFSTSPQTSRSVLIVGGGPAGLAAALMLAKRGWTEITVLEKRPTADYYEPDKSFNYLIDGRGQKFTDLLGLTEQLSEMGVSNKEFYLTRIQSNGKRKQLKLPLIDPTRKPAYWIPRRAFVHLLHQEIEHKWSRHITVLFNTRCVAINKRVKDGREILTVITEDMASCQQSLEPFFLIGCDGLHSTVRATLDMWDGSLRFKMQQFPSPSSGLRYKVLNLPSRFPLDTDGKEHSEPEMSYAIRGAFRGRTRSLSLGLLPLKDSEAPRTANLITHPDHQLWSLKNHDDMLDYLVQTFPQIPLQQILHHEEVSRFADSEGGTFPAPQFCSGLHYLLPSVLDSAVKQNTTGGILLLGDAVHCFPPDIGQGVNSALEDVFILNTILTETQDNLAQALPRYEAVRAPDVSALIHLAQTAAPWQYNQAPLRGRLWAIAFVLRLGLSKLLPIISPPAFVLIQNHELSYQDIWRREQQTTRTLIGLLSIFLITLFGVSLLLKH